MYCFLDTNQNFLYLPYNELMSMCMNIKHLTSTDSCLACMKGQQLSLVELESTTTLLEKVAILEWALCLKNSSVKAGEEIRVLV